MRVPTDLLITQSHLCPFWGNI